MEAAVAEELGMRMQAAREINPFDSTLAKPVASAKQRACRAR